MLKVNTKDKVNQYHLQIVLRNQQLVFIFGTVKKILQYLLIAALLVPATAKSQFEAARDSVVQLYGIIMTADSLVGIPAVSVVVKGQNRGTITNNQGVFSIVVLKGDEVEFTHVSYKSKTVAIPRSLEGNQYSIVQLMVADTVYLPATIIRPRPTPEQFARDFVNTKVPDDDIEVARRNTDATKRRSTRLQTGPCTRDKHLPRISSTLPPGPILSRPGNGEILRIKIENRKAEIENENDSHLIISSALVWPFFRP